jgi:hypothetical protein
MVILPWWCSDRCNYQNQGYLRVRVEPLTLKIDEIGEKTKKITWSLWDAIRHSDSQRYFPLTSTELFNGLSTAYVIETAFYPG